MKIVPARTVWSIVLPVLAMGMLTPVVHASPPSGEEPWVVRAYFADPAQVARAAAHLEPWEVNRDERYIVVDVDRQEWILLEDLGFTLVVDEARTKRMREPIGPLAGQRAGIPGYPCYRTVEETQADLAALATSYPGLASVVDAGDSWLKTQGSGGYDLLVLRITNSSLPGPKPTLFVMGSIHAREYATAELVMRFGEMLLNEYDTDPDVTWLVDHHEIHLLLHTNPDGRKRAEAGQYWRKNVNNNYCSNTSYRGVDLNRNFEFQWGCCSGSSGDQCSDVYRGPSPASDPESQAVQAYERSIFPDQWDPGVDPQAPDDATGVFIDVHSYGDLVLWPWGYTYTPAPNGTALQTLGRKLAYFNGYLPEQAVGLYPTDGTTDDFAYGDLGVAAYTFELGNDFFQDCGTFQNVILPENLDSLLYAAKASRTPYLTPAGPDALSLGANPQVVDRGDPVDLTATIDDTRFRNSNGTEPTQNVAAAEYYVEDPPWVNPGGALPMAPSDGSFDQKTEAVEATLDTSSLADGRHTVFVRGQDVQGNWGAVTAIFIYVTDPASTPTIEGTVKDATTLAPLAATVSAGSFQTATNPSTGFYSLDVPAGTYDVTAEAQGYGPVTASGVSAVPYQTTVQDFLLFPMCSLFSDDVESGAQGWTPDAPWAITDEAANSPTHSWTDSPGGDYGDDVDASLQLGPFDLSGVTGVTLTFSHIYDLEDSYDYGYVETSTDGGASWTTTAAYNGYGHTTWTQEAVALSDLDGAVDARIRFRIRTDQAVTADGWHLDDVELAGATASCGGSPPPVDHMVGRGLGASNSNQVRLFTGSGASTGVTFFAYGAGTWGVNVATAEVDGSTWMELLTGPGPGGIFGPHLKAFQRDGNPYPAVNFYAYGTLKYGVNPGSGPIDVDGYDEILSGAGPGEVFGPHVRGWNFDAATLSSIGRVNFFAYQTLKYGVNVSSGDLDGDGTAELLSGPGPGAIFGPTVRGWNYDGGALTSISKINFNAFSVLEYGVNLAGGDVDGDSFAEVAATPGPGPALSPRFLGFDYDGSSVTSLPGFDVTPAAYGSTTYGGRVGLGDVVPDGRSELITGAGRDPAAPSLVFDYTYDGSQLTVVSTSFDPFGVGYGVNVAAGLLGY